MPFRAFVGRSRRALAALMRNAWGRYAVAILMVAAAALLRLAAGLLLGPNLPLAPFYIAVAVTGVLVGTGPAIAAAWLGLLTGFALFILPWFPMSEAGGADAWASVARYFLVAPVFIWMTHMQCSASRFARDRQAEALRDREALAASEKRYRDVFEQAGIGMGRVRFSDARWIDVNDAFCAMLGYSRAELLKTPWTRITHPDDIDLDLVPFREMAKGLLDRYTVEKRFVHKRGHHFWARLTLTMVRNDLGAPDYEVAVIEDIDERKRAEEARRQSEERHRLAAEELQAVADSVPGGILVAQDAQCRVITGNRFAHESLGVAQGFNLSATPGESAEPPYVRILQNGQEVPPDDLPMQLAGRTGQTVRDAELALELHDHSWRVVLITAAPLRRRDGSIRGVVGAFVDITDRKRSEESLRELTRTLEDRVAERTAEARQKAEQLRRLHTELIRAEQRERKQLARVLHDGLQQLLVAAKMRVELLKDQVDGDQPREELRQVEELLAASIQDTRSLTAELAPPVLFERGLGSALDWLARSVGEKQWLHVEVQVEPGAEPEHETARVFLFQAARELLLNVRKYAGVQEARVRLARGDGGLVLEVADDGKGFDLAEITRERTSGGFGLFSVREQLAILEGRMEIDSTPGRGTRVRLWVPQTHGQEQPSQEAADGAPAANWPALPGDRAGHAAEADAVAAADADGFSVAHGGGVGGPQPTRRSAPPKGRHRVRVLIADDHAIVRQGLTEMLSALPDVEVVGQAGDGAEALELALRLRPDAVVMDVSMPRMSGVVATARIRHDLPSTQVIGLSMYVEEELAAAMFGAGAVAYLRKDGPIDRLIEAIRACCGRPVPEAV